MQFSDTVRRILATAIGMLILSSAGLAFQAKKGNRITSTDPALRLKGFEQYQEMKKKSPFKDLKWQFAGPTNVGGRCVDVAVVSPKGKNYTIYVASASGGIWKTENEGTTWDPVFEQAASTSFGDIAVAPSDPNIVWVGTGEANIFRSSQAGIGVFKSTDAGKTWLHMGLPDTYTIPRIVIHPKNPDVVYVAATGHEWTTNSERGVYKTTDGGKTWQKILFVNDQTGAIDLVMDPNNPETLYAATWQRTRVRWNDPCNKPDYTGSGIHKTTDGGKTWEQINKGLPEAQFRGRIGIDIARSNPNVLYAFVDNYQQSATIDSGAVDSYGRPSSGAIRGATVFRTDDAGESWKQTSGQVDSTRKYMERHSSTYGWVFGQLRVDPNDENTVYTMGLGLNVSTDGGKTFKPLRGMHGDHHGLWIDPENSKYLMNVNDGGAYVSYDKGKNWRSFTDKIPATQFFNIAFDMDTPFKVYGSVQDYGSFKGVIDLSRGRDNIPAVKFDPAPGGEGSTHVIDPTNPAIVYSAGFYGTITRSDVVKGTSKRLLPRTFDDEPKMRGEWVAPFTLSPHNSNILYHGMQYVLKSLDQGNTWEQISPDLTYNMASEMGDISYHTLTSISESPLKFGLIYAGTDDGRVHMTRDGGEHWQEIMEGLPYQKWVSRIVASAYDLGTVYMTQTGKRDDDFTPYIWKSTNFGKTWVDISKGIPLGPINVIREDPRSKDILYVGTDCGVYVTKDGVKTWEALGTGLPMTYVLDLAYHPRENVIIIGTHGRGVWVLDASSIFKTRSRRFIQEED
ncbi:MAG: hypothetical protein NTU47_08150 [Ignavibacteriales bacterium]|nr:hypothetical protein [Ignavibacteriales bacterium]